ncbi:4-hydroxy-tetrahydrodipicolinate reductase [Clostridiaceae bacterium OttesenSCG-928-D20]|nr:4-hydroxy-tetrahydrodipicolinate reductase [Clostridiaceae bacterium OttesenSCG-928-D20]
MPKIIISGCNGRMGQVVSRMCDDSYDMEVVAGFDVYTEKKWDYPVYADPMEFSGKADVVIDFSSPGSLDSLLSYAKLKKTPVIFCTTGYSPAQIMQINEASKEVPLFRSGNMSLGINLLSSLVKKAAAVLGDNFDIEIVERHHKMKLDAPSGTAIMLADSASEGLSFKPDYIYERQSVRKKREKNEIGISAIRGGTIVGEHEVLFCGPDEIIEFKHSALSREVFANGAVAAARYMAAVSEPRLYNMNDVLSEIIN